MAFVPEYVPQVPVSPSDHVLSCSISLPADPCVSYVRFIPDGNASAKPYHSVELARRHLLSTNANRTILDSFLSSIHIGVSSFLYIFSITTRAGVDSASSSLSKLQLDGLVAGDDISYFSLKELYPCSTQCSMQLRPCLSCRDRSSSRKFDSHSSLLPRKPLRVIYSHFLEAIRIRLLSDIAYASLQDTPNRAARPVKRLKGGFLLGSPASTNEWNSSWEYRTLLKPLLYCHLQIHLLNTPDNTTPDLIIHPVLLPTQFLPLAHVLPLAPGTPIVLLPYGTPAFFLTHYSGPISALSKQFLQSLQGLGVDGWDLPTPGFFHGAAANQPQFIIAWINVENKQGEDKGIVLIYPTALCLSFSQSSSSGSHSRLPLDCIPELPTPLQPSPHVSVAAIPAALVSPTSTIVPPPSSSASLFWSSSNQEMRPVLPDPPSSDSIRAFRAFTLSRSKDIQTVASEVAGYVDAIARERERERERLKRERESGVSSSPKLARTTTLTPSARTPASTTNSDAATSLLMTPFTISEHSSSHPAQQLPHQASRAQDFYPSPPQVNTSIITSHGGQTSPSAVSPASPAVASTINPEAMEATPASVQSSTIPAAAQPASASFESFSSDNTWGIQSLGFNMGVDFEMDMGMDITFGMNSEDRKNNFETGGGLDFDDSAFTDDDFSFFDRPSAPTRGPPTKSPVANHFPGNSHPGIRGLTPATAQPLNIDPSPLIIGDIHLSGPGPPQQIPTPSHQSSSPWVPATFGDGLTPRFAAESGETNVSLPDFLPPSPGLTPSSQPGLSTPSIQLESSSIIRPSSLGPGTFDPIPFAEYHRAIDGKYAVGKFSLPTPPDEEDRTEPLRFSWPRITVPSFTKPVSTSSKTTAISNGHNGWHIDYMEATDPRIGVVRKLIGFKRKMNFEHRKREPRNSHKISSSWIREHEDWEGSTHAIIDPTSEGDDGISEAESDDLDDTQEGTASPVLSRPSTPPPAYIPLGPTLVHTQFQHPELLPLSKPLRQPGAAVAPTNINATSLVASVPTPVSPAAMLGTSSEKSKSLEAAAFIVATEVVENPPWAEAWRASTISKSKQSSEVWLADVQSIAHLFSSISKFNGPLNLEQLFGFQEKTPADSNVTGGPSKTLRTMEAPMISIGKGDAIIQVLPTALRFWEKLGLGPRGGKKNATAFVFFEDEEQRSEQVEAWLETIAATYEAKHFGTLVPGKNTSCPCDGLFPLRFDSSFPSFVANLPASQSSLVFLIVTPVTILTLTSPILRQVFSAVQKAEKTYSEAQIHFQFVPEHLLQGSPNNPTAIFPDLELLCGSIYNRLLVPVDRTMSRRFFEHGERVRKYFQEPALTIARPIHNEAFFVRSRHSSRDVVDRNTFLHVGYQVSPCGKWILAACVDQRGEAHNLGVWLAQAPPEDDSDEKSDGVFLINKVWEFALRFAKKANVEWRLVFSRLGVMPEGELDAWANITEVKLHDICVSSVTLLSVDPGASWTFCSSRRDPETQPRTHPVKSHNASRSVPHMAQAQNIYTDISNIIYASSPYNTLPQSNPPTCSDLGLSLSLVTEPSTELLTSVTQGQHSHVAALELPHPLPLLPCSSTTLIRLPTNPSPATITMLHIHLLYTAYRPDFPTQEPISYLHAAITKNFHELAVLAGTRWRLGVNPALPFHLAAVEAMRIALDRDQYCLDATDIA